MKRLKSALCLILITPVVWCQQPQNIRQDNNGTDDLQIVVIQGEDGANIVQDGTFADTIVEVRDRNNLPIVGGAIVTVGVVWGLEAAHSGGATPGAFVNGTNSMTVTADAQGRAVISGFHPSGNGPVNIQVQASFQGHTGHVTVHQTNFPNTAAARAAGKNPGNQQSNQQAQQQSSQASNTTNASQVVSHGMSAGLKATLIIGGVGAAGAGAAYAAGAFKTNSSSGGGSCSSLTNLQSQLNSYITSVNSCESSAANIKSASCQSFYNQGANILQDICACVGSPVPSAILQNWQQYQSLAPAFGLSTPANGSCH